MAAANSRARKSVFTLLVPTACRAAADRGLSGFFSSLLFSLSLSRPSIILSYYPRKVRAFKIDDIVLGSCFHFIRQRRFSGRILMRQNSSKGRKRISSINAPLSRVPFFPSPSLSLSLSARRKSIRRKIVRARRLQSLASSFVIHHPPNTRLLPERASLSSINARHISHLRNGECQSEVSM